MGVPSLGVLRCSQGGRECVPAAMEEVGACPNPCASETRLKMETAGLKTPDFKCQG